MLSREGFIPGPIALREPNFSGTIARVSADETASSKKPTTKGSENPSLSNMGEGFINWGYTVTKAAYL